MIIYSVHCNAAHTSLSMTDDTCRYVPTLRGARSVAKGAVRSGEDWAEVRRVELDARRSDICRLANEGMYGERVESWVRGRLLRKPDPDELYDHGHYAAVKEEADAQQEQ